VRERADIWIAAGKQPRVVDQTLAVLREDKSIYERGGDVVRLTRNGIEPVQENWMLDYLGRHIRYFTTKKVNDVPVDVRLDPPLWLPGRIAAKRGERGLKELKAQITAPTLRSDGSILCEPGYDEAAQLFLVPGDWPKIPTNPSKAQMIEAVETLLLPFREFPFVDNTALAVHLAALLTVQVRHITGVTPAFSYDAPAAGTGKTLLAMCVQALAGMPPEAIPECRDEEELRKRLLSIFRTGQLVTLFDNVRGEFTSPAFEACLTSHYYKDRVLGSSEVPSYPNSTVFLISGNNFRAGGDLGRRILTCRIDARTDNPERRSFELEPLSYCQFNRQKMNAAAITLLRGFVVAGRPKTTTDRLASFEQWDDLVRQCIIWLGTSGFMPKDWNADGDIPLDERSYDPAVSMEQAKALDSGHQTLFAFLTTMRELNGDQRWQLRAQVTKIESDRDRYSKVFDIFDEIAGERGVINRRRLGKWCHRNAERRCNGLRLERAGEAGGSAWWRVASDDQT
jgi:hypothetical protein